MFTAPLQGSNAPLGVQKKDKSTQLRTTLFALYYCLGSITMETYQVATFSQVFEVKDLKTFNHAT